MSKDRDRVAFEHVIRVGRIDSDAFLGIVARAFGDVDVRPDDQTGLRKRICASEQRSAECEERGNFGGVVPFAAWREVIFRK